MRNEKNILNATKYFIDIIGDKEVHILKNSVLPKIDKKERDYIEGILNTLSNAQDTLKEKIISRSSGKLHTIAEETIQNIEFILDEVREHRDNSMISGKLMMNAHKSFKYTSRDIAKLACYELMEIYKLQKIKGWKASAIKTIKNEFKINLIGDVLHVSLTKISSPDKKYILTLPKLTPKEKLTCPTFGVTL